MTFDNVRLINQAPGRTRAEQIADYFPQGLIALGTMTKRSADLAEEFASLGVEAYDLEIPSNHPVFREPIK